MSQLLSRFTLQPRFDHLLRALPDKPFVMAAAEDHHRIVMETYRRFIDPAHPAAASIFVDPCHHELTTVINLQLEAPVASIEIPVPEGEIETTVGGDLGIRTPREIAPPHAHVASWALTAHLIDGVRALHGYASDVDTMAYGSEQAKPVWVRGVQLAWRVCLAAIPPHHLIRA